MDVSKNWRHDWEDPTSIAKSDVNGCVKSPEKNAELWKKLIIPIGSTYGIFFTYIYDKYQPNVAKYTSAMDPMGLFQAVFCQVF